MSGIGAWPAADVAHILMAFQSILRGQPKGLGVADWSEQTIEQLGFASKAEGP